MRVPLCCTCKAKWVFQRAALDLRGERLAIALAFDADVVQARLALDGIGFAVDLDLGHTRLARELVHMHLQITVLPALAQLNHRVVLPNLHVITGQLATQIGGTLA